MTKLLLRNITAMVLYLIIGLSLLISAPFCTLKWLQILSVTFVVWDFLLAYLYYRQAKKIAEEIDSHIISISRELILHYELIKYSIYGENKSENKSEGEVQKQAKESAPAEADRQDEIEDYCAHPI